MRTTKKFLAAALFCLAAYPVMAADKPASVQSSITTVGEILKEENAVLRSRLRSAEEAAPGGRKTPAVRYADVRVLSIFGAGSAVKARVLADGFEEVVSPGQRAGSCVVTSIVNKCVNMRVADAQSGMTCSQACWTGDSPPMVAVDGDQGAAAGNAMPMPSPLPGKPLTGRP